eukprot:m.180613 g.180613  ORF g.180613 m.180613 type:complete len:1065 (+) comp16859_c0_seq1:178-3372(+)
MSSSVAGISGQQILHNITEHIHAFSGAVSRLHLLVTGNEAAANAPHEHFSALLEELQAEMIATCRLTEIQWESTLQDGFEALRTAIEAWNENSNELTRDAAHQASESLRARFLSAVNRYLQGEDDDEDDGFNDTTHDYQPTTVGEDPSEAILESVSAAARQDAQLCANVQEALAQRDDGVSAVLLAAKTLSKYLKEVHTYLEKRALIQADYERKLKSLADSTIQSVRETGAQPGHEEVLQMLAAHSERSARVVAQCTGTNHKLTHTAPVADARQLHDRVRKANKDNWVRDCRKLGEAVDKYTKTKASYTKAANEWERSLTQRQAAEESKYKLKLDKRNKEESDLRQKVADLRTAHVASLGSGNAARADLLRTREETIESITDSIFGCGQSLKEALLTYHQDEYRVHLADSNDAHHLQERLDVYRSAPDVARCLEDTTAQSDQFSFPEQLQFEPHALALERVNYLNDRGLGNACLDQLSDDSPTTSPMAARGSISVMSAQEVARQPDMHAFTRLTIPSKCRHCKKSCYFHAVYCSKCHIACHRRCTEELEVTCSLAQRARAVSMVKKLRQQSVFGASLADSLTDGEDAVPVLVRRLCEAVERRGIESEGIYRLSGVKSRVEDICARFEANPRAVSVDDEDPITLAAVLKLYLRQLPEPAVPLLLQPAFMAVAKQRMDDNDNDDCEVVAAASLAKLAEDLPGANYQTLAYLFAHLHRIGLRHEVNRMKFSNLAIVFGPTLMRAPADGLQALMNMPMQSMAVEVMIKHCETVFPAFFAERTTLKPSLHARSLALQGSESPLFRRGSGRSTTRFAETLPQAAGVATPDASPERTVLPAKQSLPSSVEEAESPAHALLTAGTPAPLSVSGHNSPTGSIESTSSPATPTTATDTSTTVTPRPHRRAPQPTGQSLKQRRHHGSSSDASPVTSPTTTNSTLPAHSRLSSLASDPHTPNSPGTPSVAPKPPTDLSSPDNVLTPHLPPEIAALLNPGDLPPPPPVGPDPSLPSVTEGSSSPSPVFPDFLPPPPRDMLPMPGSNSTSPGSQQFRSRGSEAGSSDDDLDWRPDQFV